MKTQRLVHTLSMAFVLAFCGSAFAKEGGTMREKMANLTPEQRQKMADLHVKMADCLRSTRPMKECHEELAQNCKTTMGKDGVCPMMDKDMHHGHGKWMEKEGKSSASNEQGTTDKAEKRPAAE